MLRNIRAGCGLVLALVTLGVFVPDTAKAGVIWLSQYRYSKYVRGREVRGEISEEVSFDVAPGYGEFNASWQSSYIGPESPTATEYRISADIVLPPSLYYSDHIGVIDYSYGESSLTTKFRLTSPMAYKLTTDTPESPIFSISGIPSIVLDEHGVMTGVLNAGEYTFNVNCIPERRTQVELVMTPEPGVAGLMALGAMGLLRRRR